MSLCRRILLPVRTPSGLNVVEKSSHRAWNGQHCCGYTNSGSGAYPHKVEQPRTRNRHLCCDMNWSVGFERTLEKRGLTLERSRGGFASYQSASCLCGTPVNIPDLSCGCKLRPATATSPQLQPNHGTTEQAKVVQMPLWLFFNPLTPDCLPLSSQSDHPILCTPRLWRG